jgi:hypothetical protein
VWRWDSFLWDFTIHGKGWVFLPLEWSSVFISRMFTIRTLHSMHCNSLCVDTMLDAKCLLFCDVVQCGLVIGYWWVWTACQSHLQAIDVLSQNVNNKLPPNITAQQRYWLHYSKSLKSCIRYSCIKCLYHTSEMFCSSHSNCCSISYCGQQVRGFWHSVAFFDQTTHLIYKYTPKKM